MSGPPALDLACALAMVRSPRALVGQRRQQLELRIWRAMNGDARPEARDAETAIRAVVEAAIAAGMTIPRAVEVFNEAVESGVRPVGRG